jgi:hypothetical protein
MSSSSSCISSYVHLVGSLVEREIDGYWYPAKIESIDNDVEDKNVYYTIRYLDDSKLEVNVPADEIRQHFEEIHIDTLRKQCADAEVKHSLQKPLKGLVEDDSKERSSHMPTVVIHNNQNEQEDAICLKGAENKLAAGGGLRALRYLRK